MLKRPMATSVSMRPKRARDVQDDCHYALTLAGCFTELILAGCFTEDAPPPWRRPCVQKCARRWVAASKSLTMLSDGTRRSG
jgi:hypothetical protein